MIPSPDAIRTVIGALNEVGCPYIVTGSIVSSAYSEPRATKDADFVVHAQSDDLQQIFNRLRGEFEHEPQMAFETVTGKLQHKFRYRRSPFLVELFEADFNDPHEQSRFDRRISTTLLGLPTSFPTAEDVVVGKLRWLKRISRAKDREDVIKVLRHQWENLNWEYMERWCREHSSSGLLTELRTLVGESRNR